MGTTYSKTSLDEFDVIDLKTDAVPMVFDDWSLAFRLGFSGKTFWYAVTKRDSFYKKFAIKKATGGKRWIHNPNGLMRLIARQIRARILLPLCSELGPHVGAYQVGKSVVDTAKLHLFECVECAKLDQPHTCNMALHGTDKQYHLKRWDIENCIPCTLPITHDCSRRGVKIHLDLKDFFASTRRAWIRKYFQERVGYNHYVSGLLAHLLTVKLDAHTRVWNGVPQGSPASGDICNLIADWRLDRKVMEALPEWRYTRYADDIYLSHPKNLNRSEVDNTIKTVSRLCQDAGYTLNRKKLHVQRPRRRQKVLGITVNQRIGMNRELYRKLRSLLHNCILHGFESQVTRAKKESVHALRGWIVGQFAYLQNIDSDKVGKLKLMYEHALRLHSNPEGEASFDFK